MKIKLRTAALTCAWTGATVVAVCALAAALTGPGYQWELWSTRTGFTILRWSVYIALGAAVVAAIGLALSAFARSALAAIVGVAGIALALTFALPTWNLQRTGAQVPRIHDITTDTANPPQFVTLLPVREKASNGAAYGGPKVARQQQAAYPDIQPVLSADSPQKTFERALAAAKSMGWEIVAAVAADGRIEATATTRWFRFKDDLVIRIQPEGTGSRVDIRSMSRIGRSDLGTNARRIRAYVALFQPR